MTEHLQKRGSLPRNPTGTEQLQQNHVQLGWTAVVTRHDAGIALNNASIDGYRSSLGIDEAMFDLRSMRWEKGGAAMFSTSATTGGPKDANDAWASFDDKQRGTATAMRVPVYKAGDDGVIGRCSMKGTFR